MHRNPWWFTPAGMTLDAGAFVAALEFATGKRATILGKPSAAVFRASRRRAAGGPRRAGARDRRSRWSVTTCRRTSPRRSASGFAGSWSCPARRTGRRPTVPPSGPWPRAGRHRPLAGRGRGRARLTATFPTPDRPHEAHHHDHRVQAAHQDHVRDAERRQRGAARRFEAGADGGPSAASAARIATTSTARGATATAPSRRARRSTGTPSSGTFARATAADVDDAVAAARAAQPAWAAVPWRERVAIIRRAADLISERLMAYSADMAIEVGKNRIEALGEVEESRRPAALLRPDDGGQRRLRPRDGQPRRRRGPHPLGPPAARRLRGHQPVQLPDGPRHRPDRRPR